MGLVALSYGPSGHFLYGPLDHLYGPLEHLYGPLGPPLWSVSRGLKEKKRRTLLREEVVVVVVSAMCSAREVLDRNGWPKWLPGCGLKPLAL